MVPSFSESQAVSGRRQTLSWGKVEMESQVGFPRWAITGAYLIERVVDQLMFRQDSQYSRRLRNQQSELDFKKRRRSIMLLREWYSAPDAKADGYWEDFLAELRDAPFNLHSNDGGS
jgi:hypothetical protein